MFGNALGWVVSAVLGAFVGALIFYGGRIDPPTPPTKDSDITLGLHSAALPVSPADLVTPGKEDADASESYRAAADDFRSNQYKYDQANQSPKFKSEAESKKYYDGLRASVPELEGFKLIERARDCAKGSIYADRLPMAINYDNAKPDLDALKSIGTVMVRYAGLVAKTDRNKAQKALEAVFVMGRRMYDERIVWAEYYTGTDLMGNAAHIMSKFTEKDPAKAAKFDEFSSTAQDHQKRYVNLWTAISGIDETSVATHAGDIRDLAINSQDPMWRTEAILKLGRMRFMKGVPFGDQKGAVRLLKQMSDDASLDPRVRAAAQTARDLTVEKFRTFG